MSGMLSSRDWTFTSQAYVSAAVAAMIKGWVPEFVPFLAMFGLETLAPHSSRFDATEDGAHVRVNGSTMNGVISRLLGLACE